MKIAGIIAEYNPFHNGHLYQIEETRRLCQADAVVIVMSGDFVQRGSPALLPKRLRAKAALEAGADVVLELPAVCACASAELFAEGGVSLLHSLGCVDSLCFGSECGSLSLLSGTAEILREEPESYRVLLQQFLREGLSFPAARQKALTAFTGDPETGNLLASPNNILGTEYLKALKRLESPVRPVTVRRLESAYHDQALSGAYSSATAVRSLVLSALSEGPGDGSFLSGIPARLGEVLPAGSFRILTEFFSCGSAVTAEDFSLLLKYRLLVPGCSGLDEISDVSPELAARIKNQLDSFSSWEQFCQLLKTKELTYTRISRALLHILLDIRKDFPLYQARPLALPCARILGFRRNSAEVLKTLRTHSRIPLVTRYADLASLSPKDRLLLEKDSLASDIWQSVLAAKTGQDYRPDFRQKLVTV